MSERLVWADAARTGACGLVVLVHVNIHTRPGLETWWPLGFLGVPLFSLAVPTFMTLAGYFAEGSGAGELPGKGRSTGRALRLVLPFFVWNVLTLGALVAEGLRPDSPAVALDILTGTWQLYFVFALLQLLVLHRYLRGRAAKGWMLVLATAATASVYGSSDLLLWRFHGGDDGSFERVAEKLFLCWTVFFFAGVWLKRHPETFESPTRKSLAVSLVALAAFYALYLLELRLEEARFAYNPRKQILLGGLPFQVLGPVLLLALLRALDRSGRAQGLLSRLASSGADTYGIYLSHAAVLVGVFAAARTLGLTTSRGFEAPVLALVTWMLSQGLVRLTRRLAPGWLRLALIGEAGAPGQA